MKIGGYSNELSLPNLGIGEVKIGTVGEEDTHLDFGKYDDHSSTAASSSRLHRLCRRTMSHRHRRPPCHRCLEFLEHDKKSSRKMNVIGISIIRPVPPPPSLIETELAHKTKAGERGVF